MYFGVTGEISRDRLSQPGMETWQGLGGCAAYLALALARLGEAVFFETAVGDDLNSAWLSPFHQAGVEIGARRLSGPTARLELGYDRKGDIAQLRFETGIESQLDVSQVSPRLWSADWILVGTAPRSYQASVIARARGLGRPVAISTQREFQGDWEELMEMLLNLDVLFINSGEVVGLRGDRLPSGLAALRAANPDLTCVVTCGERGALLLHWRQLYRVTACPGQMVNPTGAGDAFAAAWLSTFLCTENPVYALRIASVAAALALHGPAYTSLPNWEEIESELAECGENIRVESWPAASEEARATLQLEDACCHRALDRQVAR
jgi:ribokinase